MHDIIAETYKASILLASSIVELMAAFDTVRLSNAMSHKPAQNYHLPSISASYRPANKLKKT